MTGSPLRQVIGRGRPHRAGPEDDVAGVDVSHGDGPLGSGVVKSSERFSRLRPEDTPVGAIGRVHIAARGSGRDCVQSDTLTNGSGSLAMSVSTQLMTTEELLAMPDDGIVRDLIAGNCGNRP